MREFDTLIHGIEELEEDEVYDFLQQVMEEGGQDAQGALEACQKGMELVGKRFESGEYFVGDLIYAGELMSGAVDILKDALTGSADEKKKTKMVICTVKDDLHDIGKNIVKSILEVSGFDVTDLGIDTPASAIVDTVKRENIKIIALSGVLTLALDSMKATVDALRAEGLTDVKVIVGGAPVTEAACKMTGADAWACNPQETVNICKKWAEALG